MIITVTTDCKKCNHLGVCRYLGGPDTLRNDLIELVTNANKNTEYTNYTVKVACPHYRPFNNE